MNQLISKILEISEYFGKSVSSVQGGGGNTSVKLSDDTMAIKPSGKLLKDLKTQNDLTVVSLVKISDLLNEVSISEKDFTDSLRTSTVSTEMQRPSIETGFHSFLKTYVAHFHCVYSNIFNCSVDGWEKLKEIFPKQCFVEYTTPGKDLTFLVKDTFSRCPESKIIFLQNHGVILHSDDEEEIIKLYVELLEKLIEHYKIQKFEDTNFPAMEISEYEDFDFVLNHILFPDQAIYLNSKTIVNGKFSGPERIMIGAQENLQAYLYILDQIKKLKLTPNFLSTDKANEIAETEAEKKRVKEMIK